MSKPRKTVSRRAKRPSKTDRWAKVSAFQDSAISDMKGGKFETALDWTWKALALIESLDEPATLANCLQLAALLLQKLGRDDEAIDQAERSRSMSLDLGELAGVAACDGLIAYSLNQLGRTEEAMAKLEASRALYLEIGDWIEAALCLAVADLWVHGVEIGFTAHKISS